MDPRYEEDAKIYIYHIEKEKKKLLLFEPTLEATQWFVRWVGGEDQAQRESYMVNITLPIVPTAVTVKIMKLKFQVKLKIYHTKLLSENGQGDLSTSSSCVWHFTKQTT